MLTVITFLQICFIFCYCCRTSFPFSLSMIAFSNINAKIFNITKKKTIKNITLKKANIQHFHLQSSICFLRTDRVLYYFFVWLLSIFFCHSIKQHFSTSNQSVSAFYQPNLQQQTENRKPS